MTQLPNELLTQIFLSCESPWTGSSSFHTSRVETGCKRPILSVYDLAQLSLANRRLRSIVCNASFGGRFLALDASSLHFELFVYTSVTGSDVVYFGLDADKDSPSLVAPRVSLLQTSPIEEEGFAKIAEWSLSEAGAVKGSTCVAAIDGPLETQDTVAHNLEVIHINDGHNTEAIELDLSIVPTCRIWDKTARVKGTVELPDTLDDLWWNERLLAVMVPQEHMSTCPICKVMKCKWVFRPIDKNYRIFHRTWNDALQFRLPSGASVSLSVIHTPQPSRTELLWLNDDNCADSITPPRQDVIISRYGLRTSQRQCREIERFFGLPVTEDGASVKQPPRKVPSQEAKIHFLNPWM
ncbi:hypothetical protein BC830DRAFT_1157660 [Chytriomyces sp. MP71]|nr:hypothetical protein BC830DRAFT_1157660 [Chytriomyces sp. MP71]